MKPTVNGAVPTVTVGPPLEDSADDAAATIDKSLPVAFSDRAIAAVIIESVRLDVPVVLVIILQAALQLIVVVVEISTFPQRYQNTRYDFPKVQFLRTSVVFVAVAHPSMSKCDGKVPFLYWL